MLEMIADLMFGAGTTQAAPLTLPEVPHLADEPEVMEITRSVDSISMRRRALEVRLDQIEQAIARAQQIDPAQDLLAGRDATDDEVLTRESIDLQGQISLCNRAQRLAEDRIQDLRRGKVVRVLDELGPWRSAVTTRARQHLAGLLHMLDLERELLLRLSGAGWDVTDRLEHGIIFPRWYREQEESLKGLLEHLGK